MASDRSRALWQNGVALRNAWREFADPARLAMVDAEIHYGVPGPANLESATVPDAMVSLLNSFSAFSNANRAKLELEELLKEDLLERILNSEFIATAYREVPTRSAHPVSLLANDFEWAKADWENDRLFIDDKSFDRVRVINAQIENSGKIPLSNRGRPGSQAIIDDAIDRLIARGVDFQALRRVEGCQLIRVELGIAPKDGDGFSDGNLAKRIVAKCGIKAYSK